MNERGIWDRLGDRLAARGLTRRAASAHFMARLSEAGLLDDLCEGVKP